MPGLQARSPVGGTWKANDDVSLTHQCFSPSPSPSLPFSLKINKIFKKIEYRKDPIYNKKLRCLGVNLTRHVNNLHNKFFRIILKGKKGTLLTNKNTMFLRLFQIYKDSLKLVHKCNRIPRKITQDSLLPHPSTPKQDKLTLKFTWKNKQARLGKKTLKKE